MDPNPSNFPILSYVMNRLPSSFGGSNSTSTSTVVSDLESIQIDGAGAQPQLTRPEQPSSCSSDPGGLVNRMPHLSDPNVIAAMTRAVSEVAETRSVLNALGDRPDHETVDAAKARLAAVESSLSKKLEELVLSPRPSDVDRLQWRSHLAERENQYRDAAEKDMRNCKAVLQLDVLHAAYEKLLRDAEDKLVKIYRSAEDGGLVAVAELAEQLEDQVCEEVVGILQHASRSGAALDRINLSGRRLRFLPEAFCRIAGLLHLDLSKNDLQVIPDSIAGLEKLQELNVSSNHLESLPDTIGLLQNLKFLHVSCNKLVALPDSICQCRSLVELDVSFNNVTYLPTNIGYELVNLEVLSIQLNKIRSLPTSVCELRSLRSLDAHFNELRGLPLAFGRLTSLQSLNLASNFTDLTELPETFGDLTNLKELDLSNNQIHALPDTFGRLDNLTKLNLDGNPLVLPPPDIVHQGVDAVKLFMAKRWLEILVEEERKSMLQVNEQQETGWLTRSTSWLKDYVSGVSGYMSPRSPRDPILDQQL